MAKKVPIVQKQYRIAYGESDQRGIITESELDKEEHSMIEDIVNGKNSRHWENYIYDVSGRSTVTISPTKFIPDRKLANEMSIAGRYDGLQIIGAGGNEYCLREGIHNFPKVIEVFPASDYNCAKKYENLFELRKVNQEGKFEFFTREYAPLRGMDAKEAENRAGFTGFFRNLVDSYLKDNKRVGFVTPKHVATGKFPDLYDNKGNNLNFQVYRVPLEGRLPRQLLHNTLLSNDKDFYKEIRKIAFRNGTTIRTINEFKIAYMDSHPGNMSWLDGGGLDALFVTDLGSCLDVSKERYQEKYFGFDLYSTIKSFNRFIYSLDKKKNIDMFEVDKDYFKHAPSEFAYNFLRGYFTIERNDRSSILADNDAFADIAYSLYIRSFRPVDEFSDYFSSFFIKNKYKDDSSKEVIVKKKDYAN